MVYYITTVEFSNGAIRELRKRFSTKYQAEAWAKKYRDAAYDPENNIKGVYVDQVIEED